MRALVAAAFFALLIAALGILPHRFPLDPDVGSAAAIAGYNNRVAYLLAAVLLAGCLLVFAFAQRSGRLGANGSSGQPFGNRLPPRVWTTRGHLLLAAAAFGAAVLAYWPDFLARGGPYLEDSFFLSILHRLATGQIPYVDFEFMYGPSMIGLLRAWTSAFGDPLAYYGLIALREGLKYALLTLVVLRYVDGTFRRVLAFALLAPLTFNVLLGLNYDGIRQLLPVVLIATVAARPERWSTGLIAGAAAGLLMSYAHAVGIACVLAMISQYGLLWIRGQERGSLARGIALPAVALLSWAGVSSLLPGASVADYVNAVLDLMARYNRGELAFPFYWTVHSLAVFALVVLACMVAGRGLGRRDPESVESGDLFFLGGVAFAIVGLKSGLTRADLWHLQGPVIVLAYALVLPWPRRLFRFEPWAGRAIAALLAVMSATYLAGLAPAGSYVAQGWVRGLSASRIPAGKSAETETSQTRHPRIFGDPSRLSPAVRELGALLGRPEDADRPVVFYWSIWSMDKTLGVINAIYPTTGTLYSDQRGEVIRETLARNPRALVLVDREIHGRLFGSTAPEEPLPPSGFYRPTPMKRILNVTSTTHFSATALEIQAQLARWHRTVGAYVASEFEPWQEFDDLVLLRRRES